MKFLVGVSRVFVGILFIISGLIKLNDPLGFSYKLQEYFSSDVLNIPFLEPYALAISVVVVVFEVVLGVFLLIGYKPKFTVWSLLGMIIFFTFLTFYSAYFDKVKDCGCFGDAIKLTPWESFTKDVILLVLILILFVGIEHIKPIFNKLTSTVMALLTFVVCLWFGYHVLMHLPAKDFRAYKIGANISEGMSVPEDAPKPVIEYQWKFNVDGKEQIITTDGSYPNVNGEYVSVETKVIDEGYEPPIKDFSIETDSEDFTSHFLDQDNVIMVVMYSIENAEKEGLAKLKTVTNNAIRKGYKVIGLSASGQEVKDQLKRDYNLNFDTYLCDEKALKTIVRSNPGILELKKGTILQKLHWNDIDELELSDLPTATPHLNFELKKQLDSIMVLDQKYRSSSSYDDWKKQETIDSSNAIFIEGIFKKHGYPGKSLVGETAGKAAWYVIQHSNKIAKHLPLIKEAGEKGELPKSLVAMMEDRYLMGQGKKQIFGTQGSSYNVGSDNQIHFIWPIEDANNVNQRRSDVGFETTIEEYGKILFGDEFIFKDYTLQEVQSIKSKALKN